MGDRAFSGAHESGAPCLGGGEREKFGRVFTGAHTTISFDILYSMIKRSQVKFSHMNAVEFSGQPLHSREVRASQSSFRTEVCDVISDGEFKTPQYLLGQ